MPETRMERFESLAMELPVPVGRVGLAEIARMAYAWADRVTVTDEKRSLEAGLPVSCAKGCGACCRQWIPVNAADAFHLREFVRTWPADALASLQARLESLTDALSEGARASGLAYVDPDAYFAFGLACPFLEEESCSIHADRPLACREQLVVSDARHCASFPNHSIRIMDLSYRCGEALERLLIELLGRAPERIPIFLALDWAEEHAELAERRWDGEKVARALAYHLSSI